MGDFLFTLEICNDDIKGMSNRSQISPFYGMLFLYEESKDRSFHMKDCLIPLDIIFCNNGIIEKIYKNSQPCKTEECPKFYHQSDTVIEISGGACDRLKIKEGDTYQLF